MKKTLATVVATLLLVAFIATFLTGCGKKGSNKPTTTADPNDVTIISTADPNTTDTPDPDNSKPNPIADWTDERIVAHAYELLASYLAGPRDHYDFEPDEYGFKMYVYHNNVRVWLPRYVDPFGYVVEAVMGATYPYDFEPVNLIRAYEDGKYWVRACYNEHVVSSADYAHTACIEDGTLYIDGVAVCPIRVLIDGYIDLEALCAQYRNGKWNGRLVYDKNGTTAEIDCYGILTIRGEYVECDDCYPAIGPEEALRAAATVPSTQRTVALFEDGRIVIYERNGSITNSYETGVEVLSEDSWVFSPRGENEMEFNDSAVLVYVASASENGITCRHVLQVDTTTCTISKVFENSFVTLLHNYEGTRYFIHLEGSTLWAMDDEWNDIPIVYGITTIESSSNSEVVCRLDNGVTYTIDFDSMSGYYR